MRCLFEETQFLASSAPCRKCSSLAFLYLSETPTIVCAQFFPLSHFPTFPRPVARWPKLLHLDEPTTRMPCWFGDWDMWPRRMAAMGDGAFLAALAAAGCALRQWHG